MIRLTVITDKEPEIHLFNKSVVTIGCDNLQADLVLNGESIQKSHLKISEQNGLFFATNLINDPFLSINHLPFGKKQLENGDRIEIDQFEIQFEKLDEESTVDEPKKEMIFESELPKSNSQLLHLDYVFEKEIEPLSNINLNDEKLAQLLHESDPDKQNASNPSPSTSSKESINLAPKKNSKSLKDDYLRDLDDDSNQKPFSHSESEFRRKLSKKFFLVFTIVSMLLTAFFGSLIYLSLTGKSEGQESKAAQGVADIAMALTHAQLYHIKPSNQNWLDGDFLRSSLQSIIPNAESYALDLDTQGKFSCCPYTLRIYTDRDLSRFLLIAQPLSGFLNSFFSKTIIVLDSQSMELRTFKDVRNINRLLASPEPLEGINGNEISQLVKNGDLIRLSVLAYQSNHNDFSPPKNIAWIKPGAENYVYNAPRYYRLAQNLLQQAINLSTSKGSGQEVAKLKQDVNSFSKLNNLILYSDNREAALLAKHSLMLFAPSDKFLFGYLQINQGEFVEAHLLKEEKETAFVDVSSISESLAMNGEPLSQPQPINHVSEPGIDINHPIYIQLKALVITRENELKPLSAAIYYLLSQELDTPKAYFQAEFQNLYHTYLITNSRHKQIIKETILKLYHQYEEMPVNQFLNFINSVQLGHMIMQKEDSLNLIDENCVQNLENIFKHLEKCQSILELDNLVHIALTWLNFDFLKDPEELIKYQKILRNHILDQLKAFLIVNTKLVQVKADDLSTLKHILDHERLINLDEKEFFLAEFDAIVQQEKKNAHIIRSPHEI